MEASPAISTQVHDHPDFQEELTHLTDLIEYINQKTEKENPWKISPDKYWDHYGGADENTAKAFHQKAIGDWNEFKKIINAPYFGRLDFSKAKEEYETHYIGYKGFSVGTVNVVDWRAPIAQLFYKSVNDKHNLLSYFSPGGIVKGSLLLKRHLTIKNKRLEEIFDEIDCRLGNFQKAKTVTPEVFLSRELNNRGEPQLQDIVKTIQEQQDMIIRSKFDTVLLINGVAGSGKTSIAYHRLAYLLYPETKSLIKPHKTIVFSPNRLFMSYVSSLLPTLGIRATIQTTFDDWAMNRMGMMFEEEGVLRRKYVLGDSSIESFLDHRVDKKIKINDWKRSRLKGSLRFKELIEKYIDYKRQNIKFPLKCWDYKKVGQFNLETSFSKEELQTAYLTAIGNDLSYDEQRARMYYELKQQFENKFENAVEEEFNRRILLANETINESEKIQKQLEAYDFKNRVFSIPRYKQEFVSTLEKLLKKDLDEVWGKITRNDYYNLLSDKQLINKIVEGLFSGEEIKLLNTRKLAEGFFDIEDIPALFYLFLLGRGKGLETYDHIVIDEAQDFSPLQFFILKMFSNNGSMTIVGDIAQGIYAHRGISDWSELEDVFSGMNFQYEEVVQNYRATREIVEFTNEVNREVSEKKYTPSKPFNRTGEKPKIIHLQNRESMFQRISKDVKHLINNDTKNIGIIVKTPKDCIDVIHNLNNILEIKITLVSDRDTEYDYQGGVVVLPVNLSKGIEFEAVLVLDVDEATYDSNVEYDGRLLYVALTRALHVLNIYSIGKQSAYLKHATQKANVIEM